jgi:hypothetical protein
VVRPGPSRKHPNLGIKVPSRRPDTIPRHKPGNGTDRVDAPTRRAWERDESGFVTTHQQAARRDRLTNAALAAWFGTHRYTKSTKKAPGVPGLQVSNKGEWPRGNEPLDAPILSHRTNQARRGSHKQPAPSLMPPLGLEKGPYFSTSTAYRLSRWGARSVQAFDL